MTYTSTQSSEVNELRSFNEIFRKNVAYHNSKSYKKPELHPLSRRYIFGKDTARVDPPPPTSQLFNG